MRHEPIRRALSFDLVGRLTEGQGFGLSEHVGQEHVVVPPKPIERLVKRYEVTWNEPRSLMNQLVERVLAICAWLAPVDRTGIVGDFAAVEGDVFAVALHRQLLEISWEPFQVLLVRQHCDSLGAEKSVIPNSQDPHERGQVALEWSGAKMLIHLMETIEHRTEVIRADRQHRREPNGRIH